MWFDVQKAVQAVEVEKTELDTSPRATMATTATNGPPCPSNVAIVAHVARPKVSEQKNEHEPAATPEPPEATFAHGTSVTGNPRTWTGKVVSLAEWRGLSDWDRHGPKGRYWCGIRHAWVDPASLPEWDHRCIEAARTAFSEHEHRDDLHPENWS